MSLWWPGEWDRLISKFEDWILKKHGYSKMQPQRLSRGYQSLVGRPRPDRQCVTFRFEQTPAGDGLGIDNTRRKSFTAQPRQQSTVEVQLGHCVNSSLDKMENTLRQYEKAFTKLPKRGPKFTGHVLNHNLDILSEETIQKIFLKCCNIKHEDEIVAN